MKHENERALVEDLPELRADISAYVEGKYKFSPDTISARQSEKMGTVYTVSAEIPVNDAITGEVLFTRNLMAMVCHDEIL